VAQAGANSITVYRTMPDGTLDLLQAYTDPDGKEGFFCCCWSRSPQDDPWLCVGGINGGIKVIAMNNQQLARYLYGHGGDINDMKTHPKDPNILLTASKDESLRLWNVDKNCCFAIFTGSKGHCGDVLHCDFDYGGGHFCSCGMDSCIKIWDMVDPMVTDRLQASKTFDADVAAAQFDPVTVQFPIFSSNRHHMNYVDCVRYCGSLLLSKSVHSTILLWQPNKFSPKQSQCEDIQLSQFNYKDGGLWFVKFDIHLQSLLLATGSSTGKVYVWRIGEEPGQPRCTCP
jgi:polycomb protein EED